MSERIKQLGLEQDFSTSIKIDISNDNFVDEFEDLAAQFEDKLKLKYDDSKGKGGGKKRGNKNANPISTAIENANKNRETQNRNNLKKHLDELLKYFEGHEDSKKNPKNIDTLLDNYITWLQEILLSEDRKINIEKEINNLTIKNEKKSSGPGGQNVNKTATAIRITHKVTGIKVYNHESRDKNTNQRYATEKLIERLQKVIKLWLAYLPNLNKPIGEEFQKDFDKIDKDTILKLTS